MNPDEIRSTSTQNSHDSPGKLGEREKGVEPRNEETGNDAASVHSDSSSVQAGVQKALILKKAWTRPTLIIAFTR